MTVPAQEPETRGGPGADARPGHVVDSEGVQHRFAPFRHGSAPVSDQPAVRAAFADAARRGLGLPEKPDQPVSWSDLREVALKISRVDPVWRYAPFAAALAGGLATGLLAFVRVRIGTRQASVIPMFEDILLAVAVALPAYLVAVAVLRARRRTDAAAPSLLAIGRCAACGFPLRGEVDPGRDARCRCTECGAAWPAEAANRPRSSETGARTDLPEAEGVGAWRTRLALGAALRATGHDFLPDGNGTLRYIARMSSTPVSNARAFVGWLWSFATVDLPTAVGAVVVTTLGFPVCTGCLFGLVLAALAPLRQILDSDGPLAVAASTGTHSAVLAWLAVVLVRRMRRQLVRWQRTRQLRRHLRARVCPSCTMDLPRSREPLVACSCCSANWRCEPNEGFSRRTSASD